jgi:hypothetical protein
MVSRQNPKKQRRHNDLIELYDAPCFRFRLAGTEIAANRDLAGDGSNNCVRGQKNRSKSVP